MDTQMNIQDWNGILQDQGIASLQVSFQDSVLESPPTNSRAGLFLYINSMLHGVPSIDDKRVTSLLHARYHEDVPTLINDLILASFDVLANSIARSEASRSRTMIRSFIINKLPLFILEHYASLVHHPLSPEKCIRQALERLDPSSSQSFGLLSETRTDFVFACALHGLVLENHINDILGETQLTELPSGGKYTSEMIINAITSDTDRVDHYVTELENTEGNSGAIARGIVEVMHSMCASNDTMTLKSICNALSRKPAALDVLILFTQAWSLLRPFCQLLDNWQDIGDQDEQQPVYEEFGSILLFVAAVRHRFSLGEEEMGLDGDKGFLKTYFASASASRRMETLSQHEKDTLGSWIKGFYEAEEINNEVMSVCKPSEFHLLITTLLDQSLKASHVKVLPMEKLKGGFEYLLMPFLLPSLIGALNWFADLLWTSNAETPSINTTIGALQILLRQPKQSDEAAYIHTAVMYIVANRLDASVEYLQHQLPYRADIKGLSSILAPYVSDHERIVHDELAKWAKTPNGGIIAALRKSIRSLIQGSVTAATSTVVAPPHFTFNQFSGGLQILGAYKVLDALIDEVQNSSSPDVALDITAVLILAIRHKRPSSSRLAHSKLPMSLQTLLQMRFEEASELAKTDVARAQTAVRIYRRVQALNGETAVASDAGPGFTGDVAKVRQTTGHDIDDVLAEAGAHGAGVAGQGLLGSEAIDHVMAMT